MRLLDFHGQAKEEEGFISRIIEMITLRRISALIGYFVHELKLFSSSHSKWKSWNSGWVNFTEETTHTSILFADSKNRQGLEIGKAPSKEKVLINTAIMNSNNKRKRCHLQVPQGDYYTECSK